MLLDDVKMSGEATSMPHARYPPYRALRLKKIWTAAMRTREDPPTKLDDGDLFIMHDGFRPGDQNDHIPNPVCVSSRTLAF